jgi:hypothetical protein
LSRGQKAADVKGRERKEGEREIERKREREERERERERGAVCFEVCPSFKC